MASAQMNLDALVERARKHKMTPSEKHSQRISLIMGLRKKDSTLTREKVSEVLSEVEGRSGTAVE